MSDTFHHIGISLGNVIDNVIDLIPQWPFRKKRRWFKNKSHVCKRKKDDVCFSVGRTKYGKQSIPDSDGLHKSISLKLSYSKENILH